jgi:hypothetical protein
LRCSTQPEIRKVGKVDPAAAGKLRSEVGCQPWSSTEDRRERGTEVTVPKKTLNAQLRKPSRAGSPIPNIELRAAEDRRQRSARCPYGRNAARSVRFAAANPSRGETFCRATREVRHQREPHYFSVAALPWLAGLSRHSIASAEALCVGGSVSAFGRVSHYSNTPRLHNSNA